MKNTNVFVKVESEFVANVITNAINSAKATEEALSVYKKNGIARKTGKLVLTIEEANTLARALENYSKTTQHEASAKMARAIAFGTRMRTAAACKAVKAEAKA